MNLVHYYCNDVSSTHENDFIFCLNKESYNSPAKVYPSFGSFITCLHNSPNDNDVSSTQEDNFIFCLNKESYNSPAKVSPSFGSFITYLHNSPNDPKKT